MSDRSEELLATIRQAGASSEAIYIEAGGSKRALAGRHCGATPVSVAGHSGIVAYQPGELVITARAGTPLAEIQDTLAGEGQVLPFEPPLFGGLATLGGTVAGNMSGPARPWRGSLRDSVLGVQLINGRGELLNFGGRVMKNVAGYDVSRLQAGALGTLGLITQVSLKVLPRPERSITLRRAIDGDAAIESMNRLAAGTTPLSGACWLGGHMYLRCAGAAPAVEQCAEQWAGESLPDEQGPWQDLREFRLPFFAGDSPLWRLSVRPTAALPADLGEPLVDWGGALRWYRSELPADLMHAAAAAAGGHALLFRGGDRSGELRGEPPPVARILQQRLKRALDPDGLFNPGRLYSWL